MPKRVDLPCNGHPHYPFLPSPLTHRYSTPAASETSEAISTAARLGANLASGTGGQVPLNPMVRVRGTAAEGIGGTLFAVVEGQLLASTMAVEFAHYRRKEAHSDSSQDPSGDANFKFAFHTRVCSFGTKHHTQRCHRGAYFQNCN